MINKQAIYQKTPAGSAAVANRQSGLTPRLRSILIMVDGKRSFSDLCALTGECETLLDQLAQDNMIAPVGAAAVLAQNAAASPGPDSPTAATPPAPLLPASLPDAKRFTSRLLVDMLGPSSEMLCMKIESVGDLAGFVNAVRRARDVVRDVKGSAAADRFAAEVESHTP
ncbi:MAG: hypothetical protein Q7T70_17245 [Polaromonas sp.]|nr:hypothetical protein [Polaromonas sp.]